MSMGKSKGFSRRKGHRFEREFAKSIRHVFPEARRHLEYHRADATGIDLIHTGRYRFQCKRKRRHESLSAIFEIQCDKDLGLVPVLISKPDGLESLCVLPTAELIRLIEIASTVSRDYVD